MSDQVSGFTVVLRDDIRGETADALANAIRMLIGVIAVDPLVSDPMQKITEVRVRRKMLETIYATFENN